MQRPLAVLVAVRAEGADADRARLRELAREHRARPRRPVRATLDLLDGEEVCDAEAAELEGRHCDAPLGIRNAQVQRLDLVDGTERSGERCVEPRAREVALVVVGRDGGAAPPRRAPR